MMGYSRAHRKGGCGVDDVLLLSRIQFAFTVMFHYLFPPLTIGLGVVLVYLDGMSLRTGKPIYEKAAKFWTRIFALNFAVGVATGIVMEFEFGTNWATYSRFVGDVAVLVFGWNRVSPRMHFFSTCMVSLGSIFSAIWIVVANSWQQTPAGHHIVPVLRGGAPWLIDGVPVMRAEIVDFWALVFNPSSMQRLIHVWIGCLVMGGFFVMSISAWYLLTNRHREFAEHSFKGALVMTALASLAALASGHLQARNVYQTQPAKLAAFEGHFETGRGDLTLIGVPDEATGSVRYALAIPGGLSFLLFDDFETPVVGLDRFRPEDRPPLFIPFAAWRMMVGLGTFFIALTLLALFFQWRGTLFRQRWLMWIFVFAVLGAVAANQAGWAAAEVGRQPWIVHPPVPYDQTGALVLGEDGRVHYDEGLGLRTADARSPVLEADQVLGSIAMFGLLYALLFAVWIYVLNDKIQRGPEPVGQEPGAVPNEEGSFRAAAGRRPRHLDSLTEAGSDENPRERNEE
jgi:cytochrome d ubiquinol oxidase subunit I